MRTLRHLAVFLFLLLLLAAPWQASATSAPGPRQSPPTLEAAPTVLLRWAWEALTRLWYKNGCTADPNGRCSSMPAPVPHNKNGCRIDPNGQCLPTPVPAIQGKNGCVIDPNGGCHS
jgi:hypothetical protein